MFTVRLGFELGLVLGFFSQGYGRFMDTTCTISIQYIILISDHVFNILYLI